MSIHMSEPPDQMFEVPKAERSFTSSGSTEATRVNNSPENGEFWKDSLAKTNMQNMYRSIIYIEDMYKMRQFIKLQVGQFHFVNITGAIKLFDFFKLKNGMLVEKNALQCRVLAN